MIHYAREASMTFLSDAATEADTRPGARSRDAWADYLLAFQELSALTTTSLSLRQTLNTIVLATTRLIGTHRASIALHESESEQRIAEQIGDDPASELVPPLRLHLSGRGGALAPGLQPAVVPDSTRPGRVDLAPAPGDDARAWIAAPLVSKGQSIGWLYALNDDPTQFSDEQVKLTTLLANQAAIAIENALVFEETEQRLRESNALFHVAQGFVENRSLDQLLQLIVDEAQRSVPSADKVVIHLLNGDRLEPQALSRNAPQLLPSSGMRAGSGIAGRALQEHATQYVPDTTRDVDFIERSSGIRSLVVAPLLIGSNVIGTLSADSHVQNAFNASGRRLLTLLANQAAVAIDKARLLDATLAEKRRIEAIINNMADGVMMLDRERRIVSVNPALAQMLNLSTDELAGMPLSMAPYPLDLFHPDSLLKLSRSEMSAGEVQTGEPLNKMLAVYTSPLSDSADQMLGHVLVVHDVTRERELDRMQSDFISTVSHELRTPLFSIRGFARLLLDGKVKDEPTRAEFVQIIHQQSEQLTRLVNDLLDLSRLDAGHAFELRLDAVDAAQVIRGVMAQMRALADEKHLSLETRLADRLPLVRADSRALAQVLINLVGNAIKFTPHGGRVNVNAQAQDGALSISVCDTGIGIPADALPRLFERFYQVDHSSTRKAAGTGLGLFISKRIVEALNGQISVESALSKGSCFSVSIPLAE